MTNLALISEIKQNIGDKVVAFLEKDKRYEFVFDVKGDPRIQFHLQDELTGKFILCINRITTMTAGTYRYVFIAPEDSILVYDTDGRGIAYIKHVHKLEG